MDGKIDRSGRLSIERRGNFKPQYCPFNCDRFCGDSCPLFRDGCDDYVYLACSPSNPSFKIIADERVEKKEADNG